MTRGLLLLDVDGPLNPGHGARLLALAGETGLEPAWSTTWQHEANDRIGPAIELPRLPVVEFPDYDHGWKWRGVAEFAAGRPLAWFDDEHDKHEGAAEFARLREDTPTLLVHVDPRQGLGSAHLAAVREWA